MSEHRRLTDALVDSGMAAGLDPDYASQVAHAGGQVASLCIVALADVPALRRHIDQLPAEQARLLLMSAVVFLAATFTPDGQGRR